jgi:hypothetical protein
MVGQVLIALEAVRERSGRPRPLMFLAREEANASLRNCLALKAVMSIFINPL